MHLYSEKSRRTLSLLDNYNASMPCVFYLRPLNAVDWLFCICIFLLHPCLRLNIGNCFQKLPLIRVITHKQKELRGTSAFCPFHVVSCLVLQKVLRSRLFGSIVEFANALISNEIVALACDFFSTLEVAVFRQFNLASFKRVASEGHSSNGVFRCILTLGSSLKYTNPGHQQRKRDPQLGIHAGINGSASLLQVK